MSGSSVTAHRSKVLLSSRSAQPSHSFFPHAAPRCSGLTHCPVKAESAGPSPVGVAAACAGRLNLHPYPSSVAFLASSVLKRVRTLPARPRLLSADASQDMKGFCTLPCPRRDTLHARYGKCEAMVRMGRRSCKRDTSLSVLVVPGKRRLASVREPDSGFCRRWLGASVQMQRCTGELHMSEVRPD